MVYCLNTLGQKKKYIGIPLAVVSFAAAVWSCLSPIGERAIAWCNQITVAKEITLTAVPLKENQNYCDGVKSNVAKWNLIGRI